ncbi:histidine kinase [bacterium]|nr:histidine kinase [bacterium]
MKRVWIYWICQVCGWGLYAVINGVLFTAIGKYSLKAAIANITVSVLGVAVTHAAHWWIGRNQWRMKRILSLIPRILLLSFICGLVMKWSATVVSVFVIGLYTWSDITLGYSLVTTFNFSFMVFLWMLLYFGIHYFRNYQQSALQNVQLQAAKREAELSLLKAQLNPHFLFNALNSIRALTVENPAKAQDAITHLANMLRYTLQSQNDRSATFAEELQTVRDYLALESLRFEERLRVEWNIDPKSESLKMPSMLLQPLIENAIKHGVSHDPKGGEIRIESSVNNHQLIVRVTNSGRLNGESDSTKIGVENIRGRLRLMFGETAVFSLQQHNINTVCAEIQIPVNA